MFSLQELQEQVNAIAEKKRAVKPPEKTFTNGQVQKASSGQRAGLEKLIEMEKERADPQSMLRWTMVSASDNRQTSSCCDRGNCERGERRDGSTEECKKR
jgi:hypothetical protein